MRKRIIVCATALIMTLLCATLLLMDFDLKLQDSLYQKRSTTSGDIVIIGIDEKAFELLGPYQEWNRDIVARVVEYLNESEEVHPAVICLDVLYSGNRDADFDKYLADACAGYNNVVAASAATFGVDVAIDSEGVEKLDDMAIVNYEEAYDELRAVTDTGVINAMLDSDGVLRHHMLRLQLDDGTIKDSMVLAAAKKLISDDTKLVLPSVDKNNFWYLSYSGKPGDFSESISVADILLEEIPADYFAGKIVFIGPYATGMQDGYVTAIDHANPMYGVEFQANALQAILKQEYKKEVSYLLQFVILFFILLLSLYLFAYKSIKVSTSFWVVENIAYISGCILLYQKGFVLYLLYVPLCTTIGYVGCIAINYIRSLAEKREITNTFKQYVAPEVVNEILKAGKDNLSLGGKVVDIAVLFVDVRGFTTMSEKLKPEQVVKILNDYLTLIADCIIRNGGTLDKFVGDAAMAIWGAPLPTDDYVMKAVMAASDMVAGSENLSKTLAQKYGTSVSFGVGVHVGEAVVGNMGSPMRMDYTAIGDTVNTAARLEANAPAGTIYISREVADRLEGRIKTKSLGDTIKLKGKSEGFEILIMEEII